MPNHFRGRAEAAIGGKVADARRGAADRVELVKLPELLGRNGKLLTSLNSPSMYSRFVIAIDMGLRPAMRC
jgi:hypothetical protein